MGRLKDEGWNLTMFSVVPFQFHIGAIRSIPYKKTHQMRCESQFHCGATKSENLRLDADAQESVSIPLWDD